MNELKRPENITKYFTNFNDVTTMLLNNVTSRDNFMGTSMINMTSEDDVTVTSIINMTSEDDVTVNTMINMTSDDEYHDVTFETVYAVSRNVQALVTILGNLLTIAVVARFKRLQTPSNVLVASLAVADLITGLSTPVAFIDVAIERYAELFWLCKS